MSCIKIVFKAAFGRKKWKECESLLEAAARRCFSKKICFKKPTIFTVKHLCWSLFLIKLQALLKRNSNTDVFP